MMFEVQVWDSHGYTTETQSVALLRETLAHLETDDIHHAIHELFREVAFRWVQRVEQERKEQTDGLPHPLYEWLHQNIQETERVLEHATVEQEKLAWSARQTALRQIRDRLPTLPRVDQESYTDWTQCWK